MRFEEARYSTISRMEISTGEKFKIIKFAVFLAFAGTVGYLLFLTPVGDRLLTPEGRKEMVARIDYFVRSAGPFEQF